MRVFKVFDLPEDASAHEASNMSMDMYCKLYDIENLLRGRLKHSDMSKDAIDLAELVREMIQQLPLERIE